MHDHEYAGRIDAVKQRAHGRWSEILASAGVDEQILKHRNGPCPLCGGLLYDLGRLANYLHLRCRQCGVQVERELPTDENDEPENQQ